VSIRRTLFRSLPTVQLATSGNGQNRIACAGFRAQGTGAGTEHARQRRQSGCSRVQAWLPFEPASLLAVLTLRAYFAVLTLRAYAPGKRAERPEHARVSQRAVQQKGKHDMWRAKARCQVVTVLKRTRLAPRQSLSWN